MRSVPALTVALALLAGCGGAATAPAPRPGDGGGGRAALEARIRAAQLETGPVARPGPTPAGFRRRSSGVPGLSIALPRRWLALTQGDARWPGVAQTLAAARPELGPYVAGLALPDSPLALLAFDPRPPRDGASLTLLVTPRGAGPWVAGVRRSLRRSPSVVRPVRSRLVRLPAGDALRLDYVRAYGRPGARRRVVTVQYVVAGPGSLVTLTLGASAAGARRHARTVALAARSLGIEPAG